MNAIICSKKDFTDGIKVANQQTLRQGDYPEPNRWSQCDPIEVSEKEARRRSENSSRGRGQRARRTQTPLLLLNVEKGGHVPSNADTFRREE